MRLSIKQITIFKNVADSKSYSRAAEKLHLSQPAVSMQIKQLEEDTGLDLFERHGKEMHLTSAGKDLFGYAQQLLNAYDNMRDAIDNLHDAQSGHLALSIATTATYFVTRLIANFNKKYSGISVTLDVTNRLSLLNQLENYEPDLVIMGEPPKGYNLISEPLMENMLVVIASPNHPLVKKKHIRLAELMKEDFVVREEGSGTRNAISRHLDQFGYSCQTSLSVRSNDTIKQSVVAELGLGIVSLHTIQLEVEAGALVILDVESFPIRRFWHIVTHQSKKLSPVGRLFRAYVMEHAPRLPLQTSSK